MSSKAQSANTPPLCVLCGKKPQFGNHPYCGKTCADEGNSYCENCHLNPKSGKHSYCSKTCAEEAKNCNHCHQKPKYTNSDYCGKTCAAKGSKKAPILSISAKPARVGVVNNTAQGPVAKGGVVSKGPVVAPAILQPSGQYPQAAQHPQPQAAYIPPSVPSIPQPVPYTIPPTNNGPPYSNSGNQFPNTANMTANGQYPPPPPPPIKCLLPSCNVKIYPNPSGQPSELYCSKQHFDEGTNTLSEACILCKTYRQSEQDFFCGQGCRDKALYKAP